MLTQILLLTPQLPYPPRQGTSLRNFHIICGLAQSHQLSLLSFLEAHQAMVTAEMAPLLKLCAVLETVPVPKRSLQKRLMQLVTSRQPDMAHRLASRRFEQKLREMLRQRPFHIVQIEGIELARYIPIIREVSPQSKIVFDNHNAETELQRRSFMTDIGTLRRLPAAVYSWIQVQRLQKFERWACLAADGVTAVSQADAQLLRKLIETQDEMQKTKGSRSAVTVVPNSIDVKEYQLSVPEPVPSDLIFAGKMDYRPNVDGVLWFAEHVWPMILQKRPLTSWVIVGQKPHERLNILRHVPGVTITGYVESVLPYWQGAKVAIMPFRIGSGTRLKLLEAMASKTPIISTSVGAEGFPIASGKELILADEPEAIATAVLSLLDNPTKRDTLIDNATQFVQQYDWRHVVTRFETLYEAVARNL